MMQLSAPLFSVIVPVYQIEQELSKCLSSIRRQTEQRFEVLCIYDESTDHTEEILQSFCCKDDRFHILQGKKQGLSGARNVGLECAKGTYTLFVDGDDYLEKNTFQRLLSLFESFTPEIIVYGAKFFPNEQTSPYLRQTLSPVNYQYPRATPSILFSEPCAKPFVWRNAFLSSFLRKNQLRFDEKIRVAEDVAFQFAAFSRAQKVVFSQEKFYWYRIARKGSLMDCYDKNQATRLQGHVDVVKKVVADWKGQGLLKKYGTPMAVWILEFVFSDGLAVLSSSERKNIYSQTLEQLELVTKAHGHPMPLPYFARQLKKMMKKNEFSESRSFVFRGSRKIYRFFMNFRKAGAQY